MYDRPHTVDALFTDLYQLTMAQAYFESGQSGDATFSMFFRNFPQSRSYYVFCGLETALEYLENLSFGEREAAALERLGIFSPAFLDCLTNIRFTGDVRAMREGEVFFPAEPVLEVSGPIIECQLAETFLLNCVNLESMLMTKAARTVGAAQGKSVVDFAARRTHGTDAAMKFARAAYIAGFSGTSNVSAAVALDIPAVGTMAHSFITSFDSEVEAFRAYARSFPDSTTLLVDTYDTLTGVRVAIDLAREMVESGHSMRAIRLDSGDIGRLAQRARQMLDDAGLSEVRIMASGGLDEYAIDRLVRDGAPIDGFGVGTRVGTSADAPYTDFVYKLVEYDGKPVGKLSEDKATLPGRKQVFRTFDERGIMIRDSVQMEELPADLPDDLPLLGAVMESGARISLTPSIDYVREFHAERIAALPDWLSAVNPAENYPVVISEQLNKLASDVAERARPAES